MDADFCIVATGARNPLRDVGTQLTPRGHDVGAGLLRAGRAGAHRHSVSAGSGRLHLGLPALRPSLGGHLRQGRAGAGAAQAAGALHGRSAASAGRARDSTATCCPRWRRIAGREPRGGRGLDGGGRCGGLVDPITGEGLYYAIRSGDLAAQSLLAEVGGPANEPQRYRKLLRRDFAADLEFGSRLAKRVFLGSFLFGAVPARMVQFTRRSPRFASVMQDLFAGKQPYLGLKRRLMQNLNGACTKSLMSFGFSRDSCRARTRRHILHEHLEIRSTVSPRGREVIPGGVNSPVRAFRSVGGTAAVHRARRRLAPVRRGRQRIHRLRGLVGSAAAGAPASGDPGGARRGAGDRHQFRRADGAGDRAGRGDHGRGAFDRDGAAGEFRAPRRRCRRSAWRAGSRAAT